MTTAYDVPPTLLIERLKDRLQKEGKIKPPEWAPFARTGVHMEKAPVQPDWWYRRVAAILRKVYLHGPVGTSRLAAEFGGRRDDGSAPYHPRKGSRSIAREAMQQLESLGLLSKTEKKGRSISAQGRKLLDSLSHEILLNSRRRIRNSPSMQEAPDGMAMDDDELEAIRRKKLAELQQIQGQAAAEQQYREQVQAQRQTILRQILTPEARERLGRIELAYPELKENIENQLIQLAQSGRVQRQIDDPTLRQILERVIPKRRDIKIERR